MQIEFLGSGGAITTPRPGCACRLCVEAQAKGVPYSRGGPSVFVHGPNVLIDTPEEIKAELLRSRVTQIDAALEAVNGRVPVIAGSGAITTRDAIAHSQRAERAGVDALSILTPYFITPSQDEIYAYYADIAAAVSLPILGYSNPQRAVVKIAPATLGRLARDIPHFIGVKDSSGDVAETAAIIRACPPDFKVFVGRDTLIYPSLCIGAAGTVALTVNVAPRLAVGIYEAFQAGDHARAHALQERLSILREGLPRFGSYPVWVKEAMALQGLPAGPTRKPILPLRDEQRAEPGGLIGIVAQGREIGAAGMLIDAAVRVERSFWRPLTRVAWLVG